jgi:hypothetical protein
MLPSLRTLVDVPNGLQLSTVVSPIEPDDLIHCSITCCCCAFESGHEPPG